MTDQLFNDPGEHAIIRVRVYTSVIVIFDEYNQGVRCDGIKLIVWGFVVVYSCIIALYGGARSVNFSPPQSLQRAFLHSGHAPMLVFDLEPRIQRPIFAANAHIILSGTRLPEPCRFAGAFKSLNDPPDCDRCRKPSTNLGRELFKSSPISRDECQRRIWWWPEHLQRAKSATVRDRRKDFLTAVDLDSHIQKISPLGWLHVCWNGSSSCLIKPGRKRDLAVLKAGTAKVIVSWRTTLTKVGINSLLTPPKPIAERFPTSSVICSTRNFNFCSALEMAKACIRFMSAVGVITPARRNGVIQPKRLNAASPPHSNDAQPRYFLYYGVRLCGMSDSSACYVNQTEGVVADAELKNDRFDDAVTKHLTLEQHKDSEENAEGSCVERCRNRQIRQGFDNAFDEAAKRKLELEYLKPPVICQSVAGSEAGDKLTSHDKEWAEECSSMLAACSHIMYVASGIPFLSVSDSFTRIGGFVAITPAVRSMLSNLLAIKSGLRRRWRRASNALGLIVSYRDETWSRLSSKTIGFVAVHLRRDAGPMRQPFDKVRGISISSTEEHDREGSELLVATSFVVPKLGVKKALH
ncbi:hypothetical protein JOM56_001746 [Amanita muscaria]